MIDLAERCVTALKEHSQAAFAAQLSGLAKAEVKLIQDDRTRYFEEVERELVRVLRPVQELVDGMSARLGGEGPEYGEPRNPDGWAVEMRDFATRKIAEMELSDESAIERD